MSVTICIYIKFEILPYPNQSQASRATKACSSVTICIYIKFEILPYPNQSQASRATKACSSVTICIYIKFEILPYTNQSQASQATKVCWHAQKMLRPAAPPLFWYPGESTDDTWRKVQGFGDIVMKDWPHQFDEVVMMLSFVWHILFFFIKWLTCNCSVHAKDVRLASSSWEGWVGCCGGHLGI
jgi:hypothetical protein